MGDGQEHSALAGSAWHAGSSQLPTVAAAVATVRTTNR
jgi:hypothetical protein